MKLKLLLLWLLSLVPINPLFAAEHHYWGISYALTTLGASSNAEEAAPTAILGKLGQRLDDRYAVEGRFGLGVLDDSVSAVDVSIDSLMGVYLLRYLPMNNTASLYGILGYTQAEVTTSPVGPSQSTRKNGVSFGIGADLGSINIEFIQYLDENDFDINAVSVGYTAKF